MKDKQPTEQEERNIFIKSFKALVIFVKTTVIDTCVKFTTMLLTAVRDLIKWVIRIEK